MRAAASMLGLVLSVAPDVRADDTAGPEVVPSAVDAGNAQRRAEIERSLVELREEEGSTPRLLPILTIALGATAVLVGAASGAVSAISCDDSCGAGAWQGPTVVGGSAVSVLGILWLRWTDADLREIETQRGRLQTERDRLEPASPDRAQAAPRVALDVRAAF